MLRGTITATSKTEVLKKKDVMGLAIHDGTLFYATAKAVFAASIKTDGTLGDERTVARDLPDVGQHNDRTLAYGPDGWLYASVGSTCNECDEQNPESATMLRVKPDGSGREVFATGLRNTIGFAFQPGTEAPVRLGRRRRLVGGRRAARGAQPDPAGQKVRAGLTFSATAS